MRPFQKEGLEEMALSRPNSHEVLQPSLGSGHPVYQIGATKCYLCIEENLDFFGKSLQVAAEGVRAIAPRDLRNGSKHDSLVALAQEKVDEDADRGQGDQADAEQDDQSETHGLSHYGCLTRRACPRGSR